MSGVSLPGYVLASSELGEADLFRGGSATVSASQVWAAKKGALRDAGLPSVSVTGTDCVTQLRCRFG